MADGGQVTIKVLLETSKVKSGISDVESMLNGLNGNEVDKLKDKFKETGKAGEEASKKTDEGFTILKGTLANLASQGVTAAINGIKNLAGAVIEIGKSSLEAYASYEQLTGGVETLFGESVDVIKRYAGNAYETAGMSANAYMETVTGFSASLLQSLGGDTAKAAQYANRAVIDMSDNANKMGTDIASIQWAYQGFAKQNYTMLDNLKLGYGGTQEEMKRLIADAATMKKEQAELGVTVDASSMSFGNIVNAISVMQAHMGIAGTTTKEAASTIEGSINMMKGAWENWLVALGTGDEEIIAENTQALVDSFITAAGNVAPRIVVIAASVFQTIAQEMPNFLATIKDELMQILPPEMQAPVLAFLDAVGAALSVLQTMAPVVAAVGGALLAYKAYSLGVATAEQARAAATLLVDNATKLLNGTMSLNPIGIIITLIGSLVGAFMYLWSTSEEFRNFWIGLWNSVCATAAAVPEWFMANLIMPIMNFFSQLWNFLVSVWSGITSTVDGAANFMWSIISSVFGTILGVATSVWSAISNAIMNPIDTAKWFIKNAIDAILGFFNFHWSLPELKLPHIVVGSYIDVPVLGTIPDPMTLRVDWYATGGYFDKPTIAGFGEAGPEMAVPLVGKRMRPFSDAVAENLRENGGGDGDVYVIIEHFEHSGSEADDEALLERIARKVKMKKRAGGFA